MKIGFFTDTYFPQISGVSTSIKILKEELVRQGHQVIIFTTTDPKAGNEPDLVRFPSVPFVAFQDRRVAYAGFDRAYQIAKEAGLDIIHTHTEFSLGLMGRYVASRLHLPTVHTYHTLYEKYTHYILNGELIQPEHVRFFSRLFCSFNDGVIVPSEMTQTTLRNYGVRTPIRVIPTGVPMPGFDPESRRTLRRTLGIGREDFVLLALSRLSKEKSIADLIRAFPQVLSQVPQAKFIIVGDGPEKAALEALAHDLVPGSYIQFTGEVCHQEVYRYYQMADVFLSASQSETQGLTYLEALVNRLPVIARSTDYLEGILAMNPDFGRLYTDLEDLPGCLVDFYRQYDPLAKTIRMEDVYAISSEKFAKEVAAFYQHVLSLPAGSRASFYGKIQKQFKEFIRSVMIGSP